MTRPTPPSAAAIPRKTTSSAATASRAIALQPGASGNQLLGNQIGMAGPSSNGLYSQDGNGAEGVLILSSGSCRIRSHQYSFEQLHRRCYLDSGNLISGNTLTGVRLVGVGANRNLIQSNYIGVGPGGGFIFGTENPGNGDAGTVSASRTARSTSDRRFHAQSRQRDRLEPRGRSLHRGSAPTVVGGVPVPATATGNSVANNMIGLTADGSQVLGNDQEGVALLRPEQYDRTRQRDLREPAGSRDLRADRHAEPRERQLDRHGQPRACSDFGNAIEGILISNSPANTIQGNATGSQVISGNQVGVAIVGAASTQNIVAGNLIGSDQTGFNRPGQQAEGVLISGASNNTIGGNLASAQNLISANHWGISSTAPGDGQPDRRATTSAPTSPALRPGQRSRSGHHQQLRQPQHDRRDQRGPGQQDRLPGRWRGARCSRGPGTGSCPTASSRTAVGIDLVAPGDPARHHAESTRRPDRSQ